MADQGGNSASLDRRVFGIRLAVALLQALALYLLTEAAKDPITFPATNPQIFEPLLLVSAFVPLILMQGLSRLRLAQLAVWVVVATIVVALLGWCDATRVRFAENTGATQLFWPDFRVWTILIPSLFVAQALVVDSVLEGRFYPSYPRHFDTAWSQAVQIVLTAAFVGLFWILLWLCDGLFKLVNVDAFEKLIRDPRFYWPASTLAMAVSIHVTDVQPALIRGIRSLALTLFSWLQPIFALILLAFLATLPFVSLEPLWATHFATATLLSAAVALILFINCCYQDGGERIVSRIKRIATQVGALELLPLVALATWALALRVNQYGWTAERITAAAITLVAACYTMGYLIALVPSRRWLARLEPTNFIAAYVFLGLVLALFTPLADPGRLMVADQTARLRSGLVSPDRFDYAALRVDGARWGAAELRKMSVGPAGAIEQVRSAQALAMTSPYEVGVNKTPPSVSEMERAVTVFPVGRPLPKGFLDAIATSRAYGAAPGQGCLVGDGSTSSPVPPAKLICAARWLTVRPGSPDAILLISPSGSSLYEPDAAGHWRATATPGGQLSCNGVADAIKSQPIQVVPHPWPDLIVAGHRIEFQMPDQYCLSQPGAVEVSRVSQ